MLSSTEHFSKGNSPLTAHLKEKMSSDEEIERFWSTVKGRAIARECSKFYSQYEGQSWKNVISIGATTCDEICRAWGSLSALGGAWLLLTPQRFTFKHKPSPQSKLQVFQPLGSLWFKPAFAQTTANVGLCHLGSFLSICVGRRFRLRALGHTACHGGLHAANGH